MIIKGQKVRTFSSMDEGTLYNLKDIAEVLGEDVESFHVCIWAIHYVCDGGLYITYDGIYDYCMLFDKDAEEVLEGLQEAEDYD